MSGTSEMNTFTLDVEGNLIGVYAHYSGETQLRVYMEGPYGTPELALRKYELFLLISSGIGTTPMQSLCNHLLHLHQSGKRKVIKVCTSHSPFEGGDLKITFKSTFESEFEDPPPTD